MSKYIILFICFASHLFSCSFSANQEILKAFDQNLQYELLEMCEEDQRLRLLWINSMGTTEEEEWRQKVIEIDDFHAIRLQEIIETYGGPGYSLVGPEGSKAFWLLVQHADDAIQNRCLPLLEQAVIDQEASPIALAYLKDRVYVHAGKKQVYGTQINGEDFTFYPIEDEEHVNERREALGFPTIEEYLELMKEHYGRKL